MSLRFRFFLIVFVCALAAILVYPNVAKRNIHVFLKSDIPQKSIDENKDNIVSYIQKNYPNQYSVSIQETTSEELKQEILKRQENKRRRINPNEYDQEEIDVIEKNFKEELNRSLENFVPEEYISISGRFIQSAFLNEINRLSNVRGERTLIAPLWVEENLKSKPFKLGLDLQGGMNLVLQGDFEKLKEDLKREYSDEKIEQLKKDLEEAEEDEKNSIQAELQSIEDLLNIDDVKKREYILGTIEIIRSRIDKTGVSEPVIRIQDNDKIEVSLPGVSSPEQAKKVIRDTAQVTYNLVEDTRKTSYTEEANEYFTTYETFDLEIERENYIKKIEKLISLPKKYRLLTFWDRRKNDLTGKLSPIQFMVVESKPALTGDDISPNTYVTRLPETGKIAVSFQLTGDGTKKFADVTKNNRNRRLAIIIDNKIRSAPNIDEPIYSGRAQISGSFSEQEAKDLALVIKEGSLPVNLNIIQETSIGPLLGKEATQKGYTAILLGLFFVVIFMIAYYRLIGIVSVLALIFNLLLIAAVLSLVGFTLTLPGIVGIILTVGMAVDGNVLIFERIKEELFRGKTLRFALQQGLERATITILDSNLTTLMAAVILSQFGTGPIKGFAVTLFIGILTTLFSSLFFTKTILGVLVFALNVKKFSMGFAFRSKLKKLA